MADPDHFSRPQIASNPVYRLLTAYPKGENVINGFMKKGYLLNTERNEIARIILDSALKRALDRVQRVEGCRQLKDWTIARAQFILWSKQIAEVFSKESCYTYYTPFKYINKEKISASGKLIKHYEYLKGKLRKAGTLAPVQPAEEVDVHKKIPAESIESSEWLRTNVESAEEVKVNWRISFRARAEFMVENSSTIAYFNAYPCLATDLGPELFKQDFQVLFPEAKTFADNWKTALPQLIQELKNCRDVPVAKRGLLESLPGLRRSNKDAIIAYLLPFLITPPAPKRKLNEVRLTTQERQEAFFIHVEREEHIGEALRRHKLRLTASQAQFPPIPVFVGDIANLEAIYVYVNCLAENPTRYEVDTVVDAIDLAFKSTFALQCNFQYRSKNIWLFIQQGLYSIKLSKDKCNQSITILLGQIAPPQENINPNLPQD